METFDLKKVY
jgi:hypothetical protein